MPVPALDPTSLTALVRDSATAPSMHNAQPWRFHFASDSRTLRISADPARAMPTSDPDRRAVHIGCGAALFNLRVAAAHAGWHPGVRLLPDPADPLLMATVHFGADAATDEAGSLAALYPAVRQRHTSRWPFDDKEVPERVRAALAEAAREEQARLAFPGQWHTEVLRELVLDAEGRDREDPGRLADIERWTRIGPEADVSTEGVPAYAFGPRKRRGEALVRDFAGRRAVAGRGATAFELVPHLALLGTTGDRALDWLRAGQAMERVLLLATLHGLATSLTSHALEWPDLRSLARDPLSAMGHVQIVLRLGYGPMGPTTPRRPVNEILDIE
ncbi:MULTISPECIES: nitroreductase family protein [unclassified Streptomyces]|uniref:Acg family FMN-binding oxidoreductase n=1 Tax=unclassified Streptomyces TaxID=2593676 RepID=UPI00278BB974|nr:MULTISPECIES: nitroreductase family protein [unclassified Streptomyces]